MYHAWKASQIYERYLKHVFTWVVAIHIELLHVIPHKAQPSYRVVIITFLAVVLNASVHVP